MSAHRLFRAAAGLAAVGVIGLLLTAGYQRFREEFDGDPISYVVGGAIVGDQAVLVGVCNEYDDQLSVTMTSVVGQTLGGQLAGVAGEPGRCKPAIVPFESPEAIRRIEIGAGLEWMVLECDIERNGIRPCWLVEEESEIWELR